MSIFISSLESSRCRCSSLMLMTTTFILVGWITDYLNSKVIATLITTFNTGRRRFHLWMWIVIFQSSVLIWRYVKWSECLLVRDESHCCNIIIWLWLFIFVQIVSHPFQICVTFLRFTSPRCKLCVLFDMVLSSLKLPLFLNEMSTKY